MRVVTKSSSLDHKMVVNSLQMISNITMRNMVSKDNTVQLIHLSKMESLKEKIEQFKK